MKFYSDIKGNQTVIIDGNRYRFVGGELETSDKKVIAELSKRYRGDDVAETKQRDTTRPEVEAEQKEAETEKVTDEGVDFGEMTVLELRDLARAEGVSIYKEGKMLNKAELIEVLR